MRFAGNVWALALAALAALHADTVVGDAETHEVSRLWSSCVALGLKGLTDDPVCSTRWATKWWPG